MRVIALFLFGAALVCVQSARAAIIGEAENRHTLEEFAAREGKPLSEVEARFGAIGTIVCPYGRGSGQLTGNNSTISTALHLFTKKTPNKRRWSCELQDELSKCEFKYSQNERDHSVQLSYMIRLGCSTKDKDFSQADDWAVVRLAKPVLGITPLKIPPAAGLQGGTPVLSVSGGAADFQRVVREQKTLVKHVASCSIRQKWPPVDEYRGSWLYITDCSSAGGSSGGALIMTLSGHDYLAGVNSHTRGMAPKIRDNVGKNGPVAKHFDLWRWSQGMAAVSPAFRDALLSAIGATESSADTKVAFDISSSVSVTMRKSNQATEDAAPVVFSRCDEQSGMRVGKTLLIVDGKAVNTLLDVQIAVNLAKARKQSTINVGVTGEGGFRRGSLSLD